MNITLSPRWASSSLQLSGQAYIDCGKPGVLNNINAFTVEAWINTTSLTTFQPIVTNAAYHANTGPFGPFLLCLDNGLVKAFAGVGSNAVSLVSTQPIAANTWCHVAATFDTTGTFCLYVDSYPVVQNSGQGTLTTSNYNLLIGGALQDGNIFSTFQGEIGRVLIWNTARAVDQIFEDSMQMSIYNAVGMPALVFYADFSVMPVVDISGNNTALTFKNNAQYLYNIPAVVLGANGYVNCGIYPDYSIPDNKPYTIEGWFSPNAATSGTLISYGAKGAWEYQVLYQNSQVMGKRNSDTLQIVSQNAVVPNSYYHFALTYDGITKALSLYINGNLQSAAYFTSPVTAVPNGTVLLGAQFDSNGNPTSFFNGAIQNIRIWNVCLEQSEIFQWLYNDVVDDDRLIANYDFTVNPPVDNTDEATLTLCNSAVAILQQTSIDPGSAIGQLGIPQSINAVYLNQYFEEAGPPPGNLSFVPQPAPFSKGHREETWAQFTDRLEIKDHQDASNSLRKQFETAYEKARQITVDNPQLLKVFTRTDENGLTRVVYHGVKGDMLIYEAPIGADSDCTIWWVIFISHITVGFFQALGLVPETSEIANRVYRLIVQNRVIMNALTSMTGKVITVSSAVGIITLIYKQGLMWAIIKFIFASAGWYALYWILKKVIAIATGLEAAELLAGFIVWAAELTQLSLEYKGSCGGKGQAAIA